MSGRVDRVSSSPNLNTRPTPVHGEKQTKVHEILRVFDLCVPAVFSNSTMLNLLNLARSSNYGPFIGMTRMQRWKRAQALNLNPPIEVRLLFADWLLGRRLRKVV